MTAHLSGASRRLAATAAVLVLAAGAFLIWRTAGHRAEDQRPGKFPEQLVYVRTNDDVVDAGALFAAPTETAKPIAVVWIHGWGVNFYSPTYVGIGRALANRGYSTITGNTRMHDIGNVEKYSFSGKRVRGGGYWGVASEEVRDLAAWIGLLEDLGFKQVVLVGHSAGWAAVRRYRSQSQDPRVVGLVFASGQVRAEAGAPDPDQLAQATKMMSDGNPDDLVRIRGRSYPSFVSAATFMDDVNTPSELGDFFGISTPNAGVTRVHCPLLAFFGTSGDVGSERELELIKSSVERQSSGPKRVTIATIRGADHMYTGHEEQVAEIHSQLGRFSSCRRRTEGRSAAALNSRQRHSRAAALEDDTLGPWRGLRRSVRIAAETPQDAKVLEVLRAASGLFHAYEVVQLCGLDP